MIKFIYNLMFLSSAITTGGMLQICIEFISHVCEDLKNLDWWLDVCYIIY